MDQYEKEAYIEMKQWEERILKRSSMIQRLSKQTQIRVNSLIPEKAHEIVTESIKKMVEGILTGSNMMTKDVPVQVQSLREQEELIGKKLASYKKTAAIEGAGTGVGGILLGMADFPLLLSIKMKFLFEIATIYGFDVRKYEERIYMLYVFQLAFSSREHRKNALKIMKDWSKEKEVVKDIEWRAFQQEYRDYIDLAKFFQLLPGVGAAVGAVANYRLLDHLGEVAINAYRIRIFTSDKTR
ncbi:EcsC family protein [Bacillus solimangrovi]|uniref:ABC transporter-associated protein EcsC n=1 Tax=Bacillus solimangrovi TaxID=1305675 RepID=A0A1E5LEB7_9BACI|nr:EcsC family protein [Bacillus solimangrovi]OEH92399.1 ABC transporter-associated protein EcsC [Bacillus solimangrovi]